MSSLYARSASRRLLRTRASVGGPGWRSLQRAIGLQRLEPRRLLAAFNLDFNFDGFGNPTTPGQTIDSDYGNLGILVSSGDLAHPPTIFDSGNPTGNDFDLGTSNQDFGGPGVGAGGKLGQPGENNQAWGRVLILQETIGGEPDDHEDGGQLYFDFDRDFTIHNVSIIDVDSGESTTTIKCYDINGVQIGSTIFAQVLGDNSFQTINVNMSGVRRMRINSPGSFAIPGAMIEDQTPPPPLPPEGRMTGGGSTFLPAGAIGGAGTRVTHGFELHCAEPSELVNNRLQVNWNNGTANRFHLLTLTDVECSDDPNIIQAPPDAPIDTLEGVGDGRFSGKFNNISYDKVPAVIEFIFVDAGEPGTSDTAQYRVTVLDGNKNGVADDPVVVLDSLGPGFLNRGNHQAHDELKHLLTLAQQVRVDINALLTSFDDHRLKQSQLDAKVDALLADFYEFEMVNDPSYVPPSPPPPPPSGNGKKPPRNAYDVSTPIFATLEQAPNDELTAVIG